MQAVPVGFVPSAPCVGPVEQLIDMGWTIRLLHIVTYVKAHSVADEPYRPIGFHDVHGGDTFRFLNSKPDALRILSESQSQLLSSVSA